MAEHSGNADRGLHERVPADRRWECAKRRRRGWDWFWTGRRPEPEPSFFGTVEEPATPRVGICCSGGGVRSAAYNLGALQSLERLNVLRGAEYLAAVSGGSYIAAAYAMVASPRVVDPDPERASDGSDQELIDRYGGPFYHGSPEEQYLRNRASYLAPGGMGKIFLLQRVLAGLAFNLFFIGLFLTVVGILLVGLLYVHWYGNLAGKPKAVPLDVPPALWIVPTAIAGVGLLLAIVTVLLQAQTDARRAALETWSARLLLLAGIVGLVTVGLPALVAAAHAAKVNAHGGDNALRGTTGTGIVGIVTVNAGVLLQLRARLAESASVLEQLKPLQRRVRRLGTGLRRAFVYFAGAVAGPLLLLAFLVEVMAVALSRADADALDAATWWFWAAVTALFLVLYFCTDLTSWSLHPFYKRRLATAFALKRVANEGGEPTGEAVERSYDDHVPLSETGLCDGWPTLLVCAAANISDTAATPPGRSVTSFTFSAEAVGGPLVGGIRTSKYENLFHSKRRRYLTLLSAVAMSGAALSPSMGKMTRRPLTFLMALSNIRLGVWVPNPQRTDAWEPYRVRRFLASLRGVPFVPPRRRLLWWRKGPPKAVARPRPSYLVREMLGRNDVTAKHLYVTDGGHYENLGLVELLRRGCTDVYCFDASSGESFASLGDAIALARTELGVEIDIDPRPLVARGARNLAPCDCVRGTITYPPTPERPLAVSGTLVYARTAMTAEAPWDVHAYHEADRTFPHDPTVDQLYTDQKFEAYRALGALAGCHARQQMAYAASRGRAAWPPFAPPGAGPSRNGGRPDGDSPSVAPEPKRTLLERVLSLMD